MDGMNATRRAFLILEDNEERIARFAAVLHAVDPGVDLYVWQSARKMAREMNGLLRRTALISLDHDLDLLPGQTEDPGDGLELVRSLVLRPPCGPVIVHTSNVFRSHTMVQELADAGWQVRRVAPIGNRWIEEDWALAVRELLGRPSGNDAVR
jgi:hypothetical protein